jgi:hypothetical protein
LPRAPVSTEVSRVETEGTIFERLTDSRLYTGHHKHRFDHATGVGKGLAGRESLSKGSGTLGYARGEDRIMDISQLMRPNLHPAIATDAEAAQAVARVGGSRSARRASSPSPSPRGQRGASGGAAQCTVPTEVTRVETEGTIFERLTDTRLYTGAHKHRFDHATGVGKGLSGRDRICKGDGTDSVPPPNANGDITHLSQLLRPHLTPRGDFLSGHNNNVRTKTQKFSSPRVFTRLTDPTGFTGLHAHRFDEEGRGKGLQGRDSIVKGVGSSTADASHSSNNATSNRETRLSREV